MKIINDILKRNELRPVRYEKNGNVYIVDTENGKYVFKKKINNHNIYNYLDSRSFDYYPKSIDGSDDEYDVFPYLEDNTIPEEQKMMDLIDLVSLLHNKTTHYKEVSEDDYKKIYEDISNNILYLESYYNDVITIIETKVFPSPYEYLLSRNISKVFSALVFCKEELDKWYESVKNVQKKRLVIIHNNLRLEHFFESDRSYLISWDKARIDIPIFDLYKLYKTEGLYIEFSSILKRYERSYPLNDDERRLLFILMSLPEKIDFSGNEYEMCEKVTRMIDYIYKTETIISPYYTKEKETE